MTRLPPRYTLFPYTTLFRSIIAIIVSCQSHWHASNRNRQIDDRESDSAKLKRALQNECCLIMESPLKLGRVTFSDRKSTRLNSSHLGISYAVFCLKKKKRRS